MPGLTIRLKRHPDGSASLTCTRADGSVTWQRQQGQLAIVFPPHDLTHFAIDLQSRPTTKTYAYGTAAANNAAIKLISLVIFRSFAGLLPGPRMRR